jgi:hypothetical protein
MPRKISLLEKACPTSTPSVDNQRKKDLAYISSCPKSREGSDQPPLKEWNCLKRWVDNSLFVQQVAVLNRQ